MLERDGLLNAPQRSSPFVLTLPLPPSVNTMTYRLGNRSSSVQAWIKSVDRYVMAMKPLTRFKEPCELRVVWPEAANFDVDNRIKPLMDYLQRIEIVENDRQFRKLIAEFGYVPLGFCRVEVCAIP